MNEEQQKAADNILAMLIGEDRGFCLLGKAGTGKSFTLKAVVENVVPLANEFNKRHNIDARYRVQLTGSTHKSVAVLEDIQNSLDRSSTHVILDEPRTLYSFLQLKLVNEQGESSLRKTKEFANIYTERFSLLLVIDEAGMLPKYVLNYLFEIAAKNPSMKLLFVYDHLQLSPPKSAEIPIHTYNIPSTELTKFMRSSLEYIDDINNYLRDVVKNKKIPDVSKYCVDLNEFTKQVNHFFTTDSKNSVLVTYTNKSTHAWNEYIYSLLPPNSSERNIRILGEAYEYVIGSKPSVVSTDTVVLLNDRGISTPLRNIQCDIVDPQVRAAKLKLLAQEAKKDKNWRTYYAYKEKTPDLRMAYARTAYKTQGSTFDNVFIDLPDIMSCKVPEIRNRLLYVAASRARKNLFILKE